MPDRDRFKSRVVARAFLVVYLGSGKASRACELHDGVELTIGRARGASIAIDDARISRRHARIRRRGDAIELEDLGSRNGTHVNGRRIARRHRVVPGDEISIGPITAIVSVGGGARLAEATRLAAEVDRSVRYARPLTLALLRLASHAMADEIARALRPMDVLVRDADDEYLLLLPELSPSAGRAVVDRLVGLAHGGATIALRAAVQCPDDGTTVAALLARLRAGGGVRGQLATVELSALVKALEAARGNQTQAARALGVTRRAVIYKMEKFGLKPRPRSPRGRRARRQT